MRGIGGVVGALCALLIAGCAQLPNKTAPVLGDGSDGFMLPNDPAQAPWQPVLIRFKTPSTFTRAEIEGVPCILGEANASWSLHGAQIPEQFASASKLSWRWHIPNLVPGADNETRHKDDAPARVVVGFKGDRDKLDAVDRSAMNMAKLIGGWELPFASIQYIWEADAKAETVIPHHTISRIKTIVVRSGETGLASWVSIERDLRADYRRLFEGEEPGEIVSVALMTDTDTLHGTARACYADLKLR
ncbi:MAG: DUF3047 domain-containing protein [Casimicrobium sp.]